MIQKMCIVSLTLFQLIAAIRCDAMEAVAHRGFSGKYPENTMQAIGQAWRVNSDIVEIDVRRTTDDMLVLFHDKEIAGREISSLRYDELQALTPDMHVAMLDDVIEQTDGNKILLLDIKDEDPRLAALIVRRVKEASHVTYYFQSTHEEVLHFLKKNLNQPTVLFVSDMQYDHFGNAPDPKTLRAWLQKNGFSGISAKGRRFIDADYVAHFTEAGLRFYVWTINKPDRMTHYANSGVSGIITDYPNLLNRK
jgi:glycerophosphoryl diester phosphodiesterase